MWLLLVNFLNHAMVQVFRAAIVKFVIFTAIALLVAALAVAVFNELVNIDLFGFSNMLSSLPDGILYFLDVFQFAVGIPMLLGAFVARFTIRRLPVIG